MSIAPTERHRSDVVAEAFQHLQTGAAAAQPPRNGHRRSTRHLKFVPETSALREQIRAEAERYAERLDRSRPFASTEIEHWAHALLGQMGLPEKFLGFAAVMLGNAFWRQQLLAVPFHRRMLLLPHCLKHADRCPAEYDGHGLECEECGACCIADFKVQAETLGYRVLVAEGSPTVLRTIIDGSIDALVGVACLNVLEKAIDKVLIAGIPSYAVPLHSGDCRSTLLDESWVREVLETHQPLPESRTSSYLPLMRAANVLFDGELERHLPRVRSGKPEASTSPLAKTERIAFDWLANGGKRFRPFITLATYDAATGGKRLGAGLCETQAAFPDAVSRVAMSIEAFHKASLVHDDIEDDDLYRYGQETLHRKYDLGTAINVGDYLIGVGYRLINSARDELGADAACDILDRMATAHVKLCDGQGAEMAWQSAPDFAIAPLDALKIYALKTAPAFEAALYAGLRMAGPVDQYEEMIPAFSRHLGVGFQILNDLKDWRGDANNKLVAGQDALALRPTVLLALLTETANAEQRQSLSETLNGEGPDGLRLGRLRRLLEECHVFDKAEALVDKCRTRAEKLAEAVEPLELQRLLHFLVDTVLAPEHRTNQGSSVLVPLPIAEA